MGMLVLSRTPGKRIRIQLGDNYVWVKVLEKVYTSMGSNVRLGFEVDGPDANEIEILREEIIRDDEPETKPSVVEPKLAIVTADNYCPECKGDGRSDDYVGFCSRCHGSGLVS